MKKKWYLLFMLIFFPFNAYAVHEVIDARCTNDLKVSLREEGKDVVYRLSKNTNGDKTTYTAYFYGLTGNIYLKDNNGNIYSNSIIENLKPGSTISINIYASNKTYCNGYKILSKIISVPYYNPYFGSEICNGYESYSLCKENVNVSLTEEEFKKKLNDYKNSLIEDEEEEIVEKVVEEEISIFDKILEYKYYLLTLFVIIVLSITTIIIVKRKKERGIL